MLDTALQETSGLVSIGAFSKLFALVCDFLCLASYKACVYTTLTDTPPPLRYHYAEELAAPSNSKPCSVYVYAFDTSSDRDAISLSGPFR